MTQNPPAADTPYLIVGLGNPGSRYVATRHNAGFMVVGEFARRHGLGFSTKQANAEVARGNIGGVKVIVTRPQTFMNNSGQAVRALSHFYKIPTERILIIYDDIALPVGTIRIREKGSAAGHNGVTSIIQQLGTQNIARIRVGVDRPADSRHSQIDWVLGRFTKDEQPIMEESIRRAAEAVEAILEIGIERAMNKYNMVAAKDERRKPALSEGFRDAPQGTKDEGRKPSLSGAEGTKHEGLPVVSTGARPKDDLSLDTLRKRIERIMRRQNHEGF